VKFIKRDAEFGQFNRGLAVNQLLSGLHEKWTLEHEAISFFICTLLSSFNCTLPNFQVFSKLLTKIFIGLDANEASFQLSVASIRYRRHANMGLNFPFTDSLLLNRISPDAINLKSFEDQKGFSCAKFAVGKKCLSEVLLELAKYFDSCLPHNYCEFSELLQNFGQLYVKDDLFTDFAKPRMPLENATSSRCLEAFTAFGTLLVIAFCSGNAIPFLVSRVVIRYAFGFPLILDDFGDWEEQITETNISKAITPFKKQLDAMKMGALKMRPIRLHSYFGLDWFPRVVQMMPFVDFKKVIEENPLCKSYIVFKKMSNVIAGLKKENRRIRLA
jgi:hypothetical protein